MMLISSDDMGEDITCFDLNFDLNSETFCTSNMQSIHLVTFIRHGYVLLGLYDNGTVTCHCNKEQKYLYKPLHKPYAILKIYSCASTRLLSNSTDHCIWLCRFVLLLQAMGKFIESSSAKIPGMTVGSSSTSSSIGPIAKKYWNRVIHLCTALKHINMEVT
jgi:hypothetical protein